MLRISGFFPLKKSAALNVFDYITAIRWRTKIMFDLAGDHWRKNRIHNDNSSTIQVKYDSLFNTLYNMKVNVHELL
ncbi:MAG: hypothetical protein A2176_02715 [Spirochaetes bacterium RBG_13_51_14]|nr:MAG: hypothetical protein A2176_02715 [Spirochaetes bacterium RBG_13_51_14]